MAFSNILPDPVNKITNAGVYDNTNGTAGPGFSSTRLRSVRDTQVSRTNSGRGITRSQGSQHWEFDVNYNPLTRDQFEPVYSFLLARNGRKSPFYVALPQYASPRDSTFATTASTYPMVVTSAVSAGVDQLTIRNPSMAGDPKPGDMFTITDPTNTNHTKAYLVTSSENSTVYETAGLASTDRRIKFTPPLTRAVATGLDSFTTTSVDTATETFTKTAHGLSIGQKVKAVSGLTGGLTADQVYYVISAGFTANAFRISTTSGGSAVNLTNTTNTTFIPSPTELVFVNPRVRCILRNDVQEYELDTTNLYQFTLNLEEIEP